VERLRLYYPVLYRGKKGRVAHECIIDLRPLKAESGISEEDISKRLMDYGFHAPTMSFPVAGTLMIEPTESEDLAEIDRFCDAMIAIHYEITKIKDGEWPLDDNPLVNAPHTQADLMATDWSHCYSRKLACFPTKQTKQQSYFNCAETWVYNLPR
jgi:glycine dehydrogenase